MERRTCKSSRIGTETNKNALSTHCLNSLFSQKVLMHVAEAAATEYTLTGAYYRVEAQRMTVSVSWQKRIEGESGERKYKEDIDG